MRVDARVYIKAKRAGRATSVRVAPTGTAVEQYQVPLGNRHSLKEAGVIGLPSWSEKATQTETWVKVPRLSATCPRRVVAFDGGKSAAIDRVMEFGDEFNGSVIDAAKWDVSGGTPAVSGGTVSLSGAATNLLAKRATSGDFIVRGGGSMSCLESSFFGVADSLSFNNYFGYNNDGGNNNQYTPQSYTGADTTSPIGATYTGYHIWEIALKFSATAATKFLIDGSLVATHSRTATYPLKPLLRTGSASGTLVMSWALVRKYVPAEPVAGTAQPSATNRALSRPMSHAGLIRAVCA